MGDAPSFVAKHGGATLRVDAGGGDETLGMTAKGVRGPTTTVESTGWELGLREVAGVDEVGRGSPFGPCCVGVVVVTPECSRPPRGLDDSKMLSASARERMAPEIRAWAHDSAVGEASAREIDLFGLTAALRLAGWRALAALRHVPGAVILDGSHDWLSIPEEGMLAPPYPLKVPLDVRAVVKGDRSCASVAAASILAKVHRDRLIEEMSETFPGYDLARNKGYATPAHLEGLRRLGPSIEHRRSWNLPAHDKVES